MFDTQRLGVIRRKLRLARKKRDGTAYTTDFTRTEADAAIQALVTRLDGSKAVLNGDIEGAAPGVFTPGDKLLLLVEAVREWALQELGERRR